MNYHYHKGRSLDKKELNEINFQKLTKKYINPYT